MKTDLDIKDAVNEFKKCINCPDPENCKTDPTEEFYLSFPKTNDTVIQNTHTSNKHNIYPKYYRNETSIPFFF